MPYSALPDRRMPYHRDGTIVGLQAAGADAGTPAIAFAQGIGAYLSGVDKIELNDGDYTGLSVSTAADGGFRERAMWLFFPERREVTAAYFGWTAVNGTVGTGGFTITAIHGSTDSTNGVDGSWETASLPSGIGQSLKSLDGWRANIKPVSFTGGKSSVRFSMRNDTGGASVMQLSCLHLYGEKVAGQTPDDLIFINHDDTPGTEFTVPEDFGDRPLGTTLVRQFRVKNASATLTANLINLQCNDTDFAISENGTTWVVTIDIASLAAGAESATLYARCTTPSPGALLGPRFTEIVAVVGSWS